VLTGAGLSTPAPPPPGERAMLERTGTVKYYESLQQPTSRSKRRGMRVKEFENVSTPTAPEAETS
jgi:hypothetical protein